MIITKDYNGFKVSLNILSELSEKEFNKLEMATEHIALMIGSSQFKDFCMQFRYFETITSGYLWWKKTTIRQHHNFKHNKNLTNEQIYQMITENVADIHLVIDRRKKRSVIGYTYPNTIKQWIYSWFLKSDYKQVAGNLIHEWCHKLGFEHDFRYNNTRKYSVPYAVGYYVAGVSK